MSEETKEAPEADRPAAEIAEAHEHAPAERADFFSPQLLSTLRKVVPAAWLLAAGAVGVVWGVQLVLLVLAAGVITLVITLMWSSVQSLTGGSPLGFEEALGMGAPSKVEEEKRSVLRALKDLEYERSVGKITQEDYAELLTKYRAEAKRLIQSLDNALGPAREEVEKSLEQRLARVGLAKPAELHPPAPADDAPNSEPRTDAATLPAAELQPPAAEEKS